jgi:hypothetical protein
MRAYGVWNAMMQRCFNPRCRWYPDYGGRGITVCERWHGFVNFLADMGEPSDGLTLDRVDNNGNYEPGNCRWATRAEQRANQRPRKRKIYRAKLVDITAYVAALARAASISTQGEQR